MVLKLLFLIAVIAASLAVEIESSTISLIGLGAAGIAAAAILTLTGAYVPALIQLIMVGLVIYFLNRSALLQKDDRDGGGKEPLAAAVAFVFMAVMVFVSFKLFRGFPSQPGELRPWAELFLGAAVLITALIGASAIMRPKGEKK